MNDIPATVVDLLGVLNSDPEERLTAAAGSPDAHAILERIRNTLGLMKKRG
jgi:hypothetical protein